MGTTRRRRLLGKTLLLATTTLSVACIETISERLSPPPVGNIVPPPPQICVQTEPSDAVVTLDGQHTSDTCTELPMGLVPVSVRVEVSAPDHVTYRETVMMESYHEEIVVTLAEVEVSPPPPVGNLIPPPAPPTVPDSVDAGCDDLVGLEAPSMMVELSGEQQACLEELLRDSTDSERRSRISRTLILNARGGDQGTWERLMVRHPQEVSSDDPDACLQYAMHRHRADDGSEQEVLELAARALAQQQWDRADIAHRLGTLHELRTRAASRRWEWSRAEGAPEREQQQHRAVVEVCAMEWLAHARASGASAEAGKALCLAAAEDPVRCQE